jgi:hypothetical protein
MFRTARARATSSHTARTRASDHGTTRTCVVGGGAVRGALAMRWCRVASDAVGVMRH